jgi:signal transduction histidine kinase
MNDEKNEFMGIAAHDLRSPLTSIQGFAELMLADSKLDEEDADLARRIRESARRMVEMVQHLLDVNAIERGQTKPTLSPCELSGLVQTVVQTYRPRAEAKGQRLHLETDGTLITALADRALIVQVLENLISNAVKYSPLEKTIQVRLTAPQNTVRCEVKDEGPGLSTEDQRRLFGKFARLSAKPTGGEPSVGLGLSIVKRIVESMGGQVSCQSELGKGATFVVELPKGREELSSPR